MKKVIRPIIGLEIHIQLRTKSKLFCNCSTQYNVLSNVHICPVCMGLPGVLPVLNQQAVDYALKMALALNCHINELSWFDRKNYFYPDLPKGYQITQYEKPLATGGYLLMLDDEGTKKIGIERIHLEEDAAKTIHGERMSQIDFNRAGIPLIEIVTAPEIKSSQDAVRFIRYLHLIARELNISDCEMEKGSLRCDANISLQNLDDGTTYQPVEIKNMNSFRSVRQALDYEIERQKNRLLNNLSIETETRFWNQKEKKTEVMRSKEKLHEYRYFPEPDLPLLYISQERIEKVRERKITSPARRLQEFKQKYGLTLDEAENLLFNQRLFHLFTLFYSEIPEGRLIYKWVAGEIFHYIRAGLCSYEDVEKDLKRIIALLNRLMRKEVTAYQVKVLLKQRYQEGQELSEKIFTSLGQQIDNEQLIRIMNNVIQGNPSALQKYREGKTEVINFFIGQIMRKIGGKVDVGILRELLREKLKEN